MIMSMLMYWLLSTAVTMYCMIEIPSAHLSDGHNIVGSFVVAALIGWFSWFIWIIVMVYVRVNPDVIRDHLKENGDPRYKDYVRKPQKEEERK